MPTYEYECTKCGKQWERLQSIKAEPERECPKCGRATARRKVGIGFAILSGGRSGDAGETGAASGASKGAGDANAPAAPAGEAKATTGGPSPAPAKDAPAVSAPKGEGKLNSTHPARDGRGAGNLRDAIARQRAAGAGAGKSGAAGRHVTKSPKKPTKGGNSRGKR
ncbi:MAG: FmdB family zinc ribbon protein [Planctomycetota bacterium]